MKTLFILMTLFSVSSSFAAETSSVLSCYSQAFPVGNDTDSAAAVCANVSSPADVKAVIACYKQAFHDSTTSQHSAGALCANVNK